MAVGIGITTTGTLERLSDKLGDTSALFEALAAAAEDLARGGFESETDPDGLAWEPLQPETEDRKGSSVILVDDGILFGSLNSSSGARNASVGFGVDYAAPHQTGAPSIGLPQRKLLPDGGQLPPAWQAELDGTIQDWLQL